MNSITLPDSLVAQIRAYESRLRRTETLLAVAGGLAGLLITYVLLFVADRFVDTPKPVRFALLVAGTGAAAWFARRWAHDWLWNRRGPAALAKMLGKHFRSLADRIQGVVELASAAELPPNVSPALCRAAIAQVAEESKRHDFTEAVAAESARKWAAVAGSIGAVTLLAFVVVPKAAFNTLKRWLAPWSNVERYTFAALEPLPPELFVAHGEPFDLAIKLRADSAWRPAVAAAHIGVQEAISSDFNEGVAAFHFPGQVTEGVLTLTIGDARRNIAVHPLHRPELKELTAIVDPPDYLGYPQSRVRLHSGLAEFLQGSWVRFEGEIARTVGVAEMQAPGFSRPVELEGAKFTTAPRLADELEGPISLQWEDTHQIKPAQPYQFKISTTADTEPRVEFKDLDPEVAILGHEVLALDLAASDDYGVKETWIGWTVRSVGEERKVLAEGQSPHAPGAAQAKEVTGQMEWSPLWHQIPDDTVVELAAYTTDFFPDRQPSISWKHTIWVLSPSKHAEKLRDRMDLVLKQLDDRIRDEERQLEENKEITSRKDDLATEKATEEIKKLEAGERQNDEQLQKLAQEMEGVMKDALRNKEIPEKTLGDWKNLTEKLQQKASPQMQEASKNMQQASNSQPQQQREQEMAQAQENQQKALDTMKEAANKMSQVNENLYARNFYNRLRHAAQQERGVSDSLKKLARTTAGLAPEEIGESERKEFDQMAGRQDTNTVDVERIYNDLGTFVVRVPNEKYVAVHKEMEEKKVVGALAELAGFVRANLGLKSVGQARSWAQQLDTWAEMLQDESQSGQGEGNSEIPPEMMELMIGMVRAAQAQDTIREQTQAVQDRQWTSRRAGGEALRISQLESELADSVGKLRDKTPVQEAKPLLDKVQELMGDVSHELRAAKSDEENVGLQGMIIELLVPPDKKGGSKSQQMSKMQQQMRQMMAKAQKPGRGNQKQASNMMGLAAEGSGAAKKGATRTVEKGGGAANAGEWPEEFRDQLQAYFQNIESEGKK